MINRCLVPAVLLFLIFCQPEITPAEFVRGHIEENNQGVELLQQGKYLEGIALLKKSREVDPYHPLLQKNLLFGYLAAGNELIKQKRYEAAAQLLLEAQEFDDQQRQFWSLRGFALLRLKQYDEAETEFKEALAMGEPDARLLFWLGEIYYNSDRMYDALDALEDALTYAPEDHAIAKMLAKVRRELAVEGQMEKEYGGHFVIAFDGEKNDELGDKVLEVLEEAYNRIGSQLDHYPDGRVTVIIYSRQQFRDLTDSPEWSGGLYDGKIRLPSGGVSAVNNAVRKVLYHEYMHVVTQDITGGNLPTWLNEGLARNAEAHIGQPDLQLLSQASASRKIPSLASLEKSFRNLSGSQVPLAYQQSYSVVRYLIDEYGWHKLRELLFALGHGLVISAAFDEIFGDYALTYRRFEEGWLRVQ